MNKPTKALVSAVISLAAESTYQWLVHGKTYTVGYMARRDEEDHEKTITEWCIRRAPRYVEIAETIADKLCAVMGHRFCNARFGYVWVDQWADKKSERLVFPARNEDVERYIEWKHGHVAFWLDEEDEDGPMTDADFDQLRVDVASCRGEDKTND